MAEKVIGFSIKLKGDDKLAQQILSLDKQLKSLTDQKKELDDDLKSNATKKSAEELEALNKKIKETELSIKATRGELNKQQKDFLKTRKAVQATSNSYNDLVAKNQALRAELKNLPNAFDKANTKANSLKKEISQVTTELKGFDKELGDSFREVGNYGSALDGLGDKLKGLNLNLAGGNTNLAGSGGALKSLIPQIAKFGGVWGIAAGAVATGAIVATDALLDLTKEINKANSEVTKLFNVTDEELQKLTSSMQATADTFGKDFNEILKVTNTLSKEFGITGGEALDLINKGFLAGADLTGEYLDTLREYPAQFKASGFSASEFISVITKQTKEGIFSDKGVDAVKEFGLAIREQTEPTKKALNDAFGKDFTDKLLKGVRDGSISTADALKQVSGALKNTGIESDRVGAVLADVFKGAGEDAGIRFIKSLENIDGELDNLIDNTDKYTQTQIQLLDANQRIELAQQQIVAAFDLTGNELSGLTDRFQALIFEGLVKLIDVGADVINFFIDLYNESILARGVIEAFGAGVSVVTDAVVLNFKAMFDTAKAVGGILKGVFTLDFDAIKTSFDEGFTNVKATIIDFGKKVGTGFTNAFENTVKLRKPIEKINKETLFKPAEKVGTEAGKAAGEGFITGIKTTTSDQKKAEAVAKKANTAAQAAFKKFFEPTKDLKIKIDPKEIFEVIEPEGEGAGIFEELFGFNEEDKAAFLQDAKDLAFNITEDINNLIFANKQARLQKETDAELTALEAQREQQLANQNLTDEQRLAIEEKFNKKRAEVELAAAKKSRALQTKEAIISAILGAGRALAAPPGFPFTVPSAALALTAGLANAAKIRATPLAKGGDFETDGPQLLLVGDNTGGRERVQVTPLSSPNINGPQVNQNFVNQQQGFDMAEMETRIASMVLNVFDTIDVRVSENEITTTQKKVKVLQGESGF